MYQIKQYNLKVYSTFEIYSFFSECKGQFATGSYYACKLGCTRGKNIDHEPSDSPAEERKSTPPQDVS